MSKLLLFALIDIIISGISFIISIFIYNYIGIDLKFKPNIDLLKNEHYQILLLLAILGHSFIQLIFRKFKKLNLFLNIKYILLFFFIYVIIIKALLSFLNIPVRIEIIYNIYFIVFFINILIFYLIGYNLYNLYLEEKHIDSREIYLKIKQYFHINPSAFFIIGFILLLFVSLLLLLIGKSKIAEMPSSLAYLMLVISVTIEIKKMINPHNR